MPQINQQYPPLTMQMSDCPSTVLVKTTYSSQTRISWASCNLIGPIGQCIRLIVETVIVVAIVESERPFTDQEPEVAFETTVVDFQTSE